MEREWKRELKSNIKVVKVRVVEHRKMLGKKKKTSILVKLSNLI